MRILVVDDDAALRLSITQALTAEGHEVVEAEDGENAVALVSLERDFDAVFLDVNMPRMSGIDALKKIKEISPQTFCLVLTAYSDVADAMTATRLGAYDYLEKPVENNRLLNMLERAREAKALVRKMAMSAPKVAFDQGREMVGSSSSIKKVFSIIDQLSKVDTSVLIRGESGTGKELVARAVHFNSERKSGPFVAVNLAAIPESLIESELFGHEKGSFTGADRKKAGKFSVAQGGTIFLDEIGDVSPAMQVKLLRVLQEKTFSPVGSSDEIKADVRIISATHRDLEDMIKTEHFRSDLFYRLNVLPICLPPLRDRVEDIESLAIYMVQKFNRTHNRDVDKVSFGALSALQSYAWPGNIRELENVIEHAFIMERGNEISLNSLPDHIKQSFGKKTVEGATVVDAATVAPETIRIDVDPLQASMKFDTDNLNFPDLKEKFEKEFLVKALQTYGGKINKTAEKTRMTKVTLLRKIEKYGINPRDFHIN